MVLSDLHPIRKSFPILVIDAGMVIDVIEVHPDRKLSLISVTFKDISIDVNDSQ
jgi:hypothetical protein